MKKPLPSLTWAELPAYYIDVYRVWPRAVLCFYAWMSWEVGHWFMQIKDPTVAQAGFPSVVFGVIPLILSFYMQNGVDWNRYRFASSPEPAPATATATATITPGSP